MSCFTADGRLEVNGLVANGLDEIKAMYVQDGRWLISKRVILSEGGMPEGLLKSYPKQ